MKALNKKLINPFNNNSLGIKIRNRILSEKNSKNFFCKSSKISFIKLVNKEFKLNKTTSSNYNRSFYNKYISCTNYSDDVKNVLEIFDKNFDKLKRSNIMPNNKDTLLIYRDCLKVCKKFYWNNDKGKKWGDVLLKAVRKDFENNRDLNDSVEIGRKQVQARQALIELENKLAKVSFDINKFLTETRTNK